MFKKGDYIVTLKVDIHSDCTKDNYCFKQKEDDFYMKPVKDLTGVNWNYNSYMTFDKKSELKDWRYATIKEIGEYNRINKPYDITTIKDIIYELW